jgi:hypothetical protein
VVVALVAPQQQQRRRRQQRSSSNAQNFQPLPPLQCMYAVTREYTYINIPFECHQRIHKLLHFVPAVCQVQQSPPPAVLHLHSCCSFPSLSK